MVNLKVYLGNSLKIKIQITLYVFSITIKTNQCDYLLGTTTYSGDNSWIVKPALIMYLPFT